MRTQRMLWLLLAASSGAVSGKEGAAGEMLNVLVSNDAGLDDGALHVAIGTARLALRDAGVLTKWMVCPPAGKPVRCPAVTDRPDITLRILQKPSGGLPVRPGEAGMALLGKPGELATFAYLYYDRLSAVADSGACSVLRVLGHVMAHEIGHLLGLDHSWRGMMSAPWTREQQSRMSAGFLLFDPQDARTLRRSAGERIRLRQLRLAGRLP